LLLGVIYLSLVFNVLSLSRLPYREVPFDQPLLKVVSLGYRRVMVLQDFDPIL
jgi:hypothetical protein